MKVCLYAFCTITDSLFLPTVIELIALYGLTLLPHTGVGILYLPTEAGKVENLPDKAIEYDQFLSALSLHVTVLPVRFATILQDISALLVWTEAHQKTIQQKLTHLAGKVEYTLALKKQTIQPIESITSWSDVVAKLPTTAVRTYLTQKLTEYQLEVARQKTIATFVTTYLPALLKQATAHEILPSRGEMILWEAVFLIDIPKLHDFMQITASIVPTPTYYLDCLGPWVCYHFANF